MRIAEANEKSARAEMDAAHARNATAAIESENLRLRTRFEEERAARLKLEDKIRPRRLSDADKALLVKALSPFAGQRIQLQVQQGESEISQYSLDFVDVFRRAKWVLDGDISTGITSVLYDVDLGGARLYVRPEELANASPAAVALHGSLARIGALTEPKLLGEHPQSELKAGMIELRLGRKPD